jgi:AcrR family transcriptional regulator
MADVKRRTKGRSGLVIAAVRRAVEELLNEAQPEQISIPQVAQRAGVHPTSIYRRWGDIGTLVGEVVRYRLDPARPVSRTGDLRHDALAWANELAEHFCAPGNVALLRAGAALAGEDGKDCTTQWREEARTLIESGSANGERELSADDLTSHVLAPIVYRAIFSKAPLGPAEIAELVDDAFAVAGDRAARAAVLNAASGKP